MLNTIAEFVKILELKRYSQSTINSYQSHLRLLKEFIGEKSFAEIADQELFDFVYSLIQIKKISPSYQRQIIGGLKLFYKEIYNRSIPFQYLNVSRREKKIPVVLSRFEVDRIIHSIINPKHKAIIALLYGSGLRIGELLNLEIRDVDSDRMLLHIRGEKGNKDRYTILSSYTLSLLRVYYKLYLPDKFLFEGQTGGKYSRESALQVFRRALTKSNINKPATLHTLRHSFATHLLENGIDISYIQKLLGHSNINTTLIYTRIANQSLTSIKSPLDINK